jgi:hypothetical protein
MSDLLAEIESFCREAGIAEATFASRAVRDGKFVKRLREGAGVTLKTVERVRAYIAAEREKLGNLSTKKGPAAAAPKRAPRSGSFRGREALPPRKAA